MTAFQLQLLQAVANGARTGELAHRHGLTVGAVRQHLYHLYGHLDARNQAHAVAIAIRRGLIG